MTASCYFTVICECVVNLQSSYVIILDIVLFLLKFDSWLDTNENAGENLTAANLTESGPVKPLTKGDEGELDLDNMNFDDIATSVSLSVGLASWFCFNIFHWDSYHNGVVANKS